MSSLFIVLQRYEFLSLCRIPQQKSLRNDVSCTPDMAMSLGTKRLFPGCMVSLSPLFRFPDDTLILFTQIVGRNATNGILNGGSKLPGDGASF